MWRRKLLEKRLAKLDQSIEEMAAQVDRSEQEEAGQENRLPEALADKQRLREEVRAKLAEMEKEDREHMHSNERDAQVMKNHEGKRLGCNAQAVVESEHGVVVAAEVTSEQNDLHQLVPMIDRVKEELGSVAEETLADSGYWNGEQ